MEPTEEYRRFAETLALYEAQRLYSVPTEVIERRLWVAAAFDWFCQSGETVTMLVGLDLPRAEAREYEKVVREAMALFSRSSKRELIK